MRKKFVIYVCYSKIGKHIYTHILVNTKKNMFSFCIKNKTCLLNVFLILGFLPSDLKNILIKLYFF